MLPDLALQRTGTSTRILLVECHDQPGLVHGITGILLRHGVNVVGNLEFVDRTSSRFFMRTEFDGEVDTVRLLEELTRILPTPAITRLSPVTPKRVVVLASREHHCVADTLIRHAYGEINATLLAVISNHDSLESLVRRFDIPFHHIPVQGTDRALHEDALLRTINAYEPDHVVLAKYMRILSPQAVARYPGRMINIHHSFLPAFVGARPYHQAYARGVKVIGATAHFVTEHLDEGPIIDQQVIPVDHSHSAEDLRRAGRDVEQMVLSRALRLVFEDRVFLCGNRTVVLD
jgi:formyltetrahydrofolate deformylase